MEEPKDFTYDKAAAREVLLKRRAEVEDRPRREAAAKELLLLLIKGSVMLYASIGSELSTDGIFSELKFSRGVDVFMPYTVGEKIIPVKAKSMGVRDRLGNMPPDCYENFMGAVEKREPQRDKPEFCVVPLLGFNGSGYRIGYGKGCYDRFLKDRNIYKIGLAFDCQKINFAHYPHDVALDCCVTETKVIYFDHARDIG